ncbi:MAG: hypothetical protein LBK83_10775, partial [Treponema sp.]|nr:hypothetical protein [Treponema sp.]
IHTIIIFVYQQLDGWRDNPQLPTGKSEPVLNPDLPKYLNACVRKTELPIQFAHEEPQGNRRSIDLAVSYDDIADYNNIITVFECKRLPEEEKNRKDEYVTGHKETTGGIQRIKLGLHGKKHNVVGMIGYVQKGTCSEWQKVINECIDSLCGKPDENDLTWDTGEYLTETEYDMESRKYYGVSKHPRSTISDVIIHHLWIEMIS